MRKYKRNVDYLPTDVKEWLFEISKFNPEWLFFILSEDEFEPVSSNCCETFEYLFKKQKKDKKQFLDDFVNKLTLLYVKKIYKKVQYEYFELFVFCLIYKSLLIRYKWVCLFNSLKLQIENI